MFLSLLLQRIFSTSVVDHASCLPQSTMSSLPFRCLPALPEVLPITLLLRLESVRHCTPAFHPPSPSATGLDAAHQVQTSNKSHQVQRPLPLWAVQPCCRPNRQCLCQGCTRPAVLRLLYHYLCMAYHQTTSVLQVALHCLPHSPSTLCRPAECWILALWK